MSHPATDDDALVARLREGDAGAARDLYERYGTPLLRFGLAVTGCRDTAEDLVQDTFVEFLQDPGRFDPRRGSVASYLHGIARHRWSRMTRSTAYPLDARALDSVAADDDLDFAMPQGLSGLRDDLTMEDAIDRTQLVEQVRQAILDLPFAHREVVALCDLVELPYATVAAILGCPIGTVRSRLHRARILLAIRLASLGVLEPLAATPSDDSDDDDRQTLLPSPGLALKCKGTVP